MGGGDLNLKKSWHPSTLRNIERVWKAEQKHEAEQQKIEQLQKELAAERAREEIHAYGEDQGVLKKRNERLDWMYQGPAALVDREDYLMGRKIDKTLEMLEIAEKGEETDKFVDTTVGSIFRPGASTSTVTVDLANKIKEDPLFAIMKREKEQKKSLLNNPVKMKQLKQMLEKSLSKGKKKCKKSSRHKEKKRRQRSSSSSSSSSDSNQARSFSKRKELSDDCEERYLNGKHQRTSYNSHREREDRNRKPNYEHDRYSDRKYRSSATKSERDHHKSRHERRDHSIPVKKEYSRDTFNNSSRYSDSQQQKNDVKKKLSAEEKERLRQEMMDNAKWRESQRQKNVQRYIKEDEIENKVGKGDASNFIRPMLSKAAEMGSVENRVKQKIFTIQRKKGDMDRNFARR